MIFKRLAIFFSITIFIIYFGLFLLLFYYWNWNLLVEILLSERTLYSIKLSIVAATIATLFALILAIPAAYALSRYDFTGKSIIDTILELPMIVSPAAMGAMLLIFFTTPSGEWIQNNCVQFVFTFYGIILTQFITVTGIATRLIKAAMDGIPIQYENVAASMGVSPSRTFLTITLPLSRNGILAASILSWAKAIGEFGATITVAGTMAMKTETLPIAVFLRLANADIEGTVVLIMVLVGIGLLTLYAVRVLTHKGEVL